MNIFTVPTFEGGPGGPGPAGAPGAPGTPSYGSIFSVFIFSATSQVFTAGVEQKINGWGTNAANAGVTPDQLNGRLIVNTPGIYEIYWGYHYRGSVAFTFNFLELRLNNVLVPQLSLTDYAGLALSASCGNSGTLQADAGDVIEVYAETNVNVTVDWFDGDLEAWRIR